ncbi:FAD-dependent oxidoreductase [Mesorhizobium sp. B2-4-19]|uniref:FAD-dependent oxidoreductase n=1 Tax=Mesorhizobium sp. B2-4-19 TaxID=2589930 RepID=UPI0032B2AB7D
MNAPANISALKGLTTPQTAMAAARPFDVAVLVLPGCSHLALHAYIEPFRIANAVSRLPLFRWQIVGTSHRQPRTAVRATGGEHRRRRRHRGWRVHGNFTAVEMAERGVRVAVLEANRVAWGASSRNGGQITGSLSGDRAMLKHFSRKLGRGAAEFIWNLRWRGHDIIEKYAIRCDLKFGHMQAASPNWRTCIAPLASAAWRTRSNSCGGGCKRCRGLMLKHCLRGWPICRQIIAKTLHALRTHSRKCIDQLLLIAGVVGHPVLGHQRHLLSDRKSGRVRPKVATAIRWEASSAPQSKSSLSKRA